MLLLLLMFTLCETSAATLKTYTLPVLREEYLAASEDEDAAKRFNKKMSAYKGAHPVVLAYQAVSEAVMAKYYWNPYHKLKQIKAATAIFEDAVALDKANPEIRFLRFTVEHYVPRYLNLSEHIAEDKRIIINGLAHYRSVGMPKELAVTIKNFMLTKDHCTEAEKKEIKNIHL